LTDKYSVSIPIITALLRLRRTVLPILIAAVLLTPASAQQRPEDLGDRSLEDLMNIEVTSVSRKDQKLSQVASAIFVITQEDIRRSGATNIPDLLRMVPGMDVGQINSNTWAISARGFNHELADKLLVLIDGRTVYTPTFGGVDWDTQDVPLEDIERIEVIRGPGGTIYGANAVNGVINVITKKAKDTPGGLVTGGGGNNERGFGMAQYGGALGDNFNYRVFAKDLNRGVTPQLDLGDSSGDNWYLLHGGFRLDGRLSAVDSLTVQGDIYNGNEGGEIVHTIIDPPQNVDAVRRAELHGGNILGRLEHTFSDGSDATFQFYFDRSARYGPESTELLNTLDFDFEHHLARHGRHDLIWGLGYRHNSDGTLGTIDLAYLPSAKTLHTFNSFVQDEITLKPDRLFLTLGTKIEHYSLSGYDLSPTARLAWTPNVHQTVWAAVSRAARVPSRLDTAAYIALAAFPSADGTTPEEVILFGNPKQKAEHVFAYELGYRSQLNRAFSLDIATFFNKYDNLRSKENGAAFFQPDPAPARWVLPQTWGNGLRGTTYGAEVSTDWRVSNRWSLSPGYTFLEMHLDTYAWSTDTTSTSNIQGSSPQHQAQLRSHLDVKRGVFWDTSLYFVGALPAQQVPSYVRLDTQFRWRLGESTEFSLVGQNLLQNVHTESNDIYTIVNASQIKRGVFARVTWRF
jgi:iron complex outermembrane receptor protein